MRVILLVFLFSSLSLFSLGQIDRMHIADSISNEAQKLYKSEMASWYGTDVFFEKFKSESQNIGGYFSFPNKDVYTCLFFSKDEKPQVLGTISFKKSYDPSNAIIGDGKRDFTPQELEFYLLRKAAKLEIEKDTSFFLSYANTNLNLIPIIDSGDNKVYVLTGTSRNDIVIIGNDYLLKFDKENKMISKKKLHANIISLKTKEEETKDGKVNMGNVHNHIPETGDFMTATDICTFMLNEKFTTWKQQMVISEKYMSIWNCETDKLIIVPTGR